jgi:hypothetical protein
MIVNLALIFIGVVILLNNMDIEFGYIKIIWPLALIGVGAVGLVEKFFGKKSSFAKYWVVFTTLGFAFYIHNVYNIKLIKLWPILLIAIGISRIVSKITQKISSRHRIEIPIE